MGKPWAIKARGLVLLALGSAAVLSQMVSLPLLPLLVEVLTLLALVGCLPVAEGATKWLAYGFLLAGLGLLLATGLSWETFAAAVTTNSLVLALLLFVYLLAIPLKLHNYRQALTQLLARVAEERFSFYAFSSFLAAILGIVLNVASVPLTQQIVSSGGHGDQAEEQLTSNAIIRGFSTSIYWSPNSGAVGLVVAFLGLRWAEVVGPGLILAVLGLVVGFVVEKIRQMGAAARAADEKEGPAASRGMATAAGPGSWRTLGEIVAAIIILLAITLVLDGYTGLGILTVVPLVAMVYPIVWCLVKGEWAFYRHEFRGYLATTLPGMKNEVVLFLSAGFFGTALASTAVAQQIPSLLQGVTANSLWLTTGVFFVIIVGLGITGLHPIVTVSIIGATVTPAALGVNPALLAMILLGAWAIAISVSPFSASNLIMSGLLKTTPFKTGLGWNWAYALVMLVIVAVYVEALQLFTG